MAIDIFKDFYYNLIPGCSFLIIWLTQDKNTAPKVINFFFVNNHFETLAIVVFILLGLALGLLLHGIFRTVNYSGRFLLRRFDKAYEKSCDKFYKYNAVLWAKKVRDLPEFFSSRASIWGSFAIMTVLLFILKIRLELHPYYVFFLFFSLLMFGIDQHKERESVKEIYKELKNKKI